MLCSTMAHQETGRSAQIRTSTSANRMDRGLTAPGMLLIGAASRNAGKTSLATALLKQFSAQKPIAAAKVTTVHQARGTCPRGREGCGICSSLTEPFRLNRERGEAEGKDTTKLLAAGADPVHWLCVHEPALVDGGRALIEQLGPRQVSLCESNSLRRVVEPGLFVIVKHADRQDIKASCRQVLDLADQVITFDGERHDPGPEAFSLVNGRWALRRKATAVVLAGGQSRRMGRDKAWLPVAGRPLIEHIVNQLRPHFEQILISANDLERFSGLGLEVVPDRRSDQGPMMAVASTLIHARYEEVFFVPCDVPRVPIDLLHRLLREARTGADVVVPVTSEGRYEPLFAIYRRRLAPILDQALEQGRRRIISIYDEQTTRRVQLAQPDPLRNLNTIEDYRSFLAETK